MGKNKLFLALTTLILGLSYSTYHAQSVDSEFNGSSGVLSIPLVVVDDQAYSIDLTLTNSDTLEFSLGSAVETSSSDDPRAASFSPAENLLRIPVVRVDDDSYAIQMNLTNDNPVTFQISKANIVNPACSIPGLPEFSTPANATVFDEVQTNTSTQNEFASIRTIVADFNDDNSDDLLWMALSFNADVSESIDVARVWLSDGENGFTDATSEFLPDGLEPDTPRQIFEADIDGDSDTDYLVLQHGYDPGGLNGKGCDNVVCPGAANIVLVLGDDGKLRDSGSSSLNPYDTNGFTHSGGVADIDCDGDMDILEGQLRNDVATAANHIQLNDGTGNFAEKLDALPESVRDFGMYGAALCDFDRDGDSDLYISSLGVPAGFSSADKLLINDGFGNFALLDGRPAPESPVGDETQRAADLRCLDYNNDGWTDILKPNEADSNFLAYQLLENNGDLTFSDVTDTKLQQTATADGAYSPKLVDFNQDGWVDILSQGTGDTIRIFWNTGEGFDEFRFPSSTAFNTAGATLTPGDFDGDGDLDIHVSRSHFESFLLIAE